MRIEVTQDDIDKGVKSCCFMCPIAAAIIRACNCKIAYVKHDSLSIFREKWSKRIRLPREAISFIDRFDSGYPVSPFDFELPIESNSIAND